MAKPEFRERMDQMFGHRLHERRKVMALARNSTSDLPDDVELARHRLERADKKRALEGQQEANTKRSRMVDSLRSDAQRDTILQAQLGHPSNHRSGTKPRSSVARNQSDGLMGSI